tara:strand:+ start:3612 stop:4433 length:822 start_codon:yes stop_codon:yes gene_type:complete
MQAHETDAYILGTEDDEITRLRTQHVSWTRQQLAILERAGISDGQTIVDLGCGPGFTSFEIAEVVGPTGRVIARDTSERFLAFLEAESVRRGITCIETSLGPVEGLALDPASLDGAYSRWLLSWLEDAAPLVHHISTALRPGGCFVLQEYIDWGAMSAVPRIPAFDRAIEACMAYWYASGQTINVAADLPRLAKSAGLTVEHMEPVARLGAIGSLEWRWVDEFLHIWLPKLVAAGAFARADYDAWREAWDAMETEGIHRIFTPIVSDVVLRKT